MKRTMMALACAFLLAAGFAALSNAGVTLPDADLDGVPDEWDNCSIDMNASQLDSDLDGIGNACDCDFDNNNFCDTADFLTLGSNFNQAVPPANPNTDMDGNLFVDTADFLALGARFNGPPGPSGLPCADGTGATIPCTGV